MPTRPLCKVVIEVSPFKVDGRFYDPVREVHANFFHVGFGVILKLSPFAYVVKDLNREGFANLKVELPSHFLVAIDALLRAGVSTLEEDIIPQEGVHFEVPFLELNEIDARTD